jgi:hypothetical protein
MAGLIEHKKKLGAFTLFESVVAIAMISVLIGLGTIIYSNLLNSEWPVSIYQAKEEISRLYNDTRTSGAFFSKQYAYENYRIDQQVAFYRGSKNIYLIQYSIYSGSKLYWTEKHLFANPHHDQ